MSTDAVVLNPPVPATASVIWLHGLGADGNDFVPVVPELRLPPTPPIRFIFPHAGLRPVTINNGYVMRAWYDILSGPRLAVEDDAGIRESEGVVRGFIDREIAAGIPAHRIVLAGFSQGGAVALQTGLRYPQRLGGILALSTYLPLRNSLPAEAAPANRDLPILVCHGTRDGVLPIALGSTTYDLLKQMGYPAEWQSYPMEHSVCMEEITAISSWLQARLA